MPNPDTTTPTARDLLALHLVPGLGPRLTRALLDRFGSAAAVLRAMPGQLADVPQIGIKLAEKLCQAMRGVDVAAELTLMERHGVHALIHGEAAYPVALAELSDPPPVLYVRGRLEEADRKAVAVVGSRHCTAYGKRIAERLAVDLVRAGYTVISGLARGIDGCAHRGALKAGGRTLAVMAGGLSRIYPPEHAELARDVEAAGALLSESSMVQEPLPGMFPARNRLISALSRGVVIVEAAEKSGALITARHAAEQGRPVFAIPGPIDSPASSGTLRLLRDGATLIRGVEDIREELEGVQSVAQPVRTEPPPDLTNEERRVWEFLKERPRQMDEMVQQLGLSVSELSRMLLELEMKKAIRRLPGNSYERR